MRAISSLSNVHIVVQRVQVEQAPKQGWALLGLACCSGSFFAVTNDAPGPSADRERAGGADQREPGHHAGAVGIVEARFGRGDTDDCLPVGRLRREGQVSWRLRLAAIRPER
jgi:hypothetical protein